jgi:iron-sulfur cluster assembly protein
VEDHPGDEHEAEDGRGGGEGVVPVEDQQRDPRDRGGRAREGDERRQSSDSHVLQRTAIVCSAARADKSGVMLVVTEQEQETIRGILEDAELAGRGGLRITGANEGNGETALEFELAEGPSAGDEVVETGGATLYLDETAAAMLADKTLDVHAHGDHFHFSLEEQ